MNLKIAHLYPELLNLYGDRGNIISLKKRAEWRGIDVEVKEYKLADEIDFENIDILFIAKLFWVVLRGATTDKDFCVFIYICYF